MRRLMHCHPGKSDFCDFLDGHSFVSTYSLLATVSIVLSTMFFISCKEFFYLFYLVTVIIFKVHCASKFCFMPLFFLLARWSPFNSMCTPHFMQKKIPNKICRSKTIFKLSENLESYTPDLLQNSR